MKKPVIYCDFDGTITENDNIIAIMKKFAPSEFEEIKDQILLQKITVRDGVSKLFSLLPTSKKDEITEFTIENAKIRAGFKELVDFARVEDIPLYIVSGGIDFFVYPILETFGQFADIFCNQSDFSGEKIEILWPYECDDQCNNGCGCCKPSIIRRLNHYENNFKIVIGDSVTDLEAAKYADFVFARDLLLKKCVEWGINHQGFTTFYDCIEGIKKRLEVKEISC